MSLIPDVDDRLSNALKDVCDIYNKIRTATEDLPDEYAEYVANYLQNDFPEALLNAPKEDAIGCIQAMDEKFEVHFYNSIITWLALYVISWKRRDPDFKVRFEKEDQTIDTDVTIRDRLKN